MRKCVCHEYEFSMNIAKIVLDKEYMFSIYYI